MNDSAWLWGALIGVIVGLTLGWALFAGRSKTKTPAPESKKTLTAGDIIVAHEEKRLRRERDELD